MRYRSRVSITENHHYPANACHLCRARPSTILSP